MQIVTFKQGDIVIKEGDDGDNLFVVEEGKLACSKVLVSYTSSRKRETPPLTSKTTFPARHSENWRFSTTPPALPPSSAPPPALSSRSTARRSTTL